MARHREVPVKVTAWVDEGIAPLVLALNEFEKVMTLDSCEGDEEGAYVLFRWRDVGALDFACRLACALPESHPYVLQAEWRPGEGEPLLALSCPQESVSRLAAAVSACRKTLFAGDSARTEPHNSRFRRHRPQTVQ